MARDSIHAKEANEKLKKSIKSILKTAFFTIEFSWDDFKQKYSGSVIGVLWAFIQPLITILLYWFIFQLVLHNGEVDGKPFIVWLISGILPWLFIADAVTMSVATLREYSYLIKKVKFNTFILPIIKPMSALFVHLFLMIISIIIFFFYGYYPNISWFKLLYYMIYMILLVTGISYIVSTLYVFFKDTAQVVSVVMQLLFWMTPIVWNLKQIDDMKTLKSFIVSSPFYYVVSGYRTVLLGGNTSVLVSGCQAFVYWIILIITFVAGICMFNGSKKHFADIL